jgi:hypothetical protein
MRKTNIRTGYFPIAFLDHSEMLPPLFQHLIAAMILACKQEHEFEP